MPVVDAGGRQIAFSDTGGDGLPIILAHGFALDLTIFAGQAALAPAYRVIAWDAPGHGASPDPGTPFTFWDLARTQLDLIDALDIDRAVVGGVSQGGFIALRTALLAPERVTALLLIDTEADALSPTDTAQYQQLFTDFATHGPTPELTAGLAAQIIGDHPTTQTWAQAWARTWTGRGIPLGAPVDCLTHRDDLTHRLAEITAPALILAGAHDHSIPLDHQDRMRRSLPASEGIVVIPGAGHCPPLTHPVPVNAAITRFLHTVPSPSPSPGDGDGGGGATASATAET